MVEIRELNAPEFLVELGLLLCDAVESGASLGFLPPLSSQEARTYWDNVFAAVGSGHRTLSVALLEGQLVGAVQLGLEMRANGSHRAEVMKLMVRRQARGRGVGRALMLHIDALARSLQRTLLVLDTRCGDVAEQLYEHLGYRRAGIIPGYARSASGVLDDTLFMYKQLDE
jgi:ribosomal protein S18 acetylase RimI-like enzyme